MRSDGKLFTQVAAEAGVPPEDAQFAVYLKQLSEDGRTMEQAARMSGRTRSEVRTAAKTWGLCFSDYAPSTPVEYEWAKLKRGEWELPGAATMRSETPDGETRRYVATCAINGDTATGSKPEIAARRLSKVVEACSVEAFGYEDVVIRYGDEIVAPIIPPEASKMRRALAS